MLCLCCVVCCLVSCICCVCCVLCLLVVVCVRGCVVCIVVLLLFVDVEFHFDVVAFVVSVGFVLFSIGVVVCSSLVVCAPRFGWGCL